MGKAGSPGGESGRLPRQLAVALDPELQNALSSPVRREVLRTLNRHARSASVGELMAELRPYGRSQLGYHLQVLRRAGAVAQGAAGTDGATARYASKVPVDGPVRAVLRATERGDLEHREATAVASASPLLTMFRVPRPVRTIRLRRRR